jgi:hypothetical protein
MSDAPEMLILYPTSSVDRLRARIEELEAALQKILTISENLTTGDPLIKTIDDMGEIARAALDKDAG